MDDKELKRVFSTSEEVARALKDNILKRKSFTNVLKTWKIPTSLKLITILEEVCHKDLSKDVQKDLLLSEIVPNMISLETETEIRDHLVDIAFILCNIILVSDLSAQEYEKFLKQIYSKYIPAISQLRDSNYQNWHKLWIFLVRFCSKKIHESMDLTNRLLRIVEYAFRNSSYEQRLKGYDCWKELINNASLDHKHMCTPKQIKLLMTPLKAKFSKQEVVISKRFDVFVYLLQKLLNQAVLCLPEFLEFCFGSVGQNKDSNRVGQAKNVPQIWAKSTKVLLSILGHSHDQKFDCMSDDCTFTEPIINESNFPNYYQIILNSVGECCSILKDENLGFKRDKVIRCMWKSILNLVISASEANRIKYFADISCLLDTYIKQSKEAPYYENVLVLIFTTFMEFNEDVIHDCVPLILKQLVIVYLTMNTGFENVTTDIKQVITYSFSKVILKDDKEKMIETVLDCLSLVQIEKDNLSHFTKIWTLLANELTVDFANEKFISFPNFEEFFMWPPNNMHHLDSINKKQMVLYWMKLYKKLTADSENKKILMLKDLENVFQNNPLTSSSISSLLSVMSQVESKVSVDFVINLMEAVSSVLQLPNLHSEDEQKLSSLVTQYFEQSLEYYSSENAEEVIKVICTCINNILSIHSGFKLIDPLVTFLKNCPSTLQEKFSSYLKNVLSDLYIKETDINSYNAKEILKCLALFTEGSKERDEEKKTFIVPIGRSARIANMGKNSPTSPNRNDKSKKNLRLFGKDVETMSPLKMKGSQLKKTPASKKKSVNIVKVKAENAPSINEENSADFVFIDSEVKLQLNKLSEHQKEVLKKRREDIPALYQDLSQSISQDMFNSKANSKEVTDQEDLATKKSLESEQPIVCSNSKQVTVNSDCDMFSETPKVICLSNEIIEEAKHFQEVSKEKEIDIQNVIPKTQDLKSNESCNVEENKILTTPKDIISLENSSISSVDNLKSSGSNKIKESVSKASDNSLTIGSRKSHGNSNRKFIGFQKDDKDPTEKKKIQELQRLKMDIVGADKFFESPRRTREKKNKPNKETSKKETCKLQEKTDTTNIKLNAVEVVADENVGVGIDFDKVPKTLISTESLDHSLKNHLNKSETTENIEQTLQSTKTEAKKKRRSKIKNNLLEMSKEDIIITPIKNVIPIDSKNINNEITPKSDVSSESNLSEKKRGRPRKNSEERKTSSAKIHQKLVSPTKSSERIAKRRQKKEESNNTNNSETPLTINTLKLTKSHKKNLFSNLTKQNSTLAEITKDTLSEDNQTIVNSNKKDMSVIDNNQNTNITPDVIDSNNDENEDVIESSQESFVEILPLLNSSKKRLSVSNESTAVENKEMEITKDVEMDNISRKPNLLEDEATLIKKYALEFSDKIEFVNDEIFSEESEKSAKETNTSQVATLTQDSQPPVQTDKNVSTVTNHALTDATNVSEEMQIKSLEPPKKPHLTESDLLMCQMDTISVCDKNILKTSSDHKNEEQCLESTISLNSVEDILAATQVTEISSSIPSTPEKSKSIPSSPVTVDTPNRTSELLDNTVDISPITSRSNSEEEISVERSIRKPIHSSIEDELRKMGEGQEEEKELVKLVNKTKDTGKLKDEKNVLESEVQKLGEKSDSYEEDNSSDEFEHTDASNETETTSLESNETNDPAESLQKLLEQSEDQVVSSIQNGKMSATINTISNRPSKESSMVQEKASKVHNIMHTISHKSFLKRKSTSTSSPSTLRIKKLMNNVGQKHNYPEVAENFNENDILTFSRVIPSPLAVPRSSILKRKFSDSSDGEGISPCPKRKRVNFSDPCLTSKKIFIKDDYEPSLEAKRLFDVLSDKKTSDENLKEIFDFPDDSASTELSTETDSEMLETEQSLVVVNPMILQRGKPIFPKLVNCKDDVLLIVKRITSPMFVPALMNKLKGKNIKTIGELAFLSESEVNRFPFKVPVVTNVIRALENYYKKKGDGDNRLEEKTDTSKEDENQNGDVEMPKVDVKLELKMLIKRAVKEKLPTEEIMQILITHVDPTKLISSLKVHCPTIVTDSLEEKDYTSVLKIIVNSKGISEILKRAHVNFYSEEKEHLFYDGIAEYVRYTVPLEKFFRGRSIEDLEVGIEESIKNKIYQKLDVVQHCLFPLLEGPKDIIPYLDTLSTVQIDEIVINRLKQQNIEDFFERIIKARPLEEVKTFSENLWSKQTLSPNKIVSTFKSTLNSQTEVCKKDVLIEMFKFCSENIDTNTLLELHMEFLSRISGALSVKK